jgi:hypothetical protein
MESLDAQLSNQYFTAQQYLDDKVLYTVKDFTNTCLLKGKCPFFPNDELILSVTMRSGRPSKEAPDMKNAPIIMRDEDTDIVTYILKKDCNPFHFVITNLTSKGPLCVQLFTNDDKPVNEINIIAAGESLIIDSQKINGKYRQLVCSSHVSFMENIIQRKLTAQETERCILGSKPYLNASQEKGALVFKFHVYPTDRTLPFFYQTKHYWSCESQFYRKEQVEFPNILETDGSFTEADSNSSIKNYKACHAILNYGDTVTGNSGRKVDMPIHYTHGYKSRILIGVMKEMCNPPTTQENKCNENPSNTEKINVPCGHLKKYIADISITESNCDIEKFCHECGEKIIALLPKDKIKHLFI